MKFINNTMYSKESMNLVQVKLQQIKDTKVLAREKNMPMWSVALLDTLLIGVALTLIFSSFTSLGLLFYFEGLDYKPYYADGIVMNNYWSLALWGFGYFMISDKMVVLFIHIHAYKIKLMGRGIQKLDMYFWKKTGKDAPVSNLLLKFQNKYMKLPKPIRFLILSSGMILWVAINFI